MKRLILAFLSVSSLAGVLLGQESSHEETQGTALDPKQTAARLAEARSKLESLPADAATGSPDASLRKAWERRVELLDEAVQLLARIEAQDASPEQEQERRRILEERRSAYEKLPALEVPALPNEEGLAELDARTTAQRDRVASLRTTETERTLYVDSIPTLAAESRKRLQSALERATRLTQESSAATDPTEKEVLGLRAENALLDAEVARLETRVIEGDREQEKSLAPLRLTERELAERRLERLEQEYGLYTRALGEAMDRETLRLEVELKTLEAAVETAENPFDRFTAARRLEITRLEKNRKEYGKYLLTLRSDLEEQKRRLAAEADELQSLREYLNKAGAGQQAGERMKFTLQRVKLRRQALERTLRRDVAAELGIYRSRRLELENELFFLKETWEREVEATALQLTNPEVSRLGATAGSLFELYRTAVREERDLVEDVIGVGEKLQVALIDRRNALDELEGFIRSRVFWIRDAKPLGPAIWSRVVAESAVVATWAGDLRTQETLDRFSASIKRPGAVAVSFLLFIVLPIGLFWARQRLRRIVTRMNDRTLEKDARIMDRVLAVTTGAVSVALLPVFFFVASRITLAADLPETIAPVLSLLLEHLAVFLFFLFLSRSFFSGRGTAQVQFGMDRDAAHALHRSLRIVLLGYLVFFCLRTILSRPPFLLDDGLPLEALPRVAYTLFLILAVFAGILLLRPRSDFSIRWVASLGDSLIGRRWSVLSSLICVAGAGLVVLEIAGYRYSAGVLARGLVQSLAVLLLLVPLYKGLTSAIESVAGGRRSDHSPSDAESVTEQADVLAPAEGQDRQIRRFLRVLFIIGGMVLLAGLWGIDVQTFSMLDGLKAYDVRGSEEFVSVGDLLRGVFYLVGTYFLLKYLPGIYEYTLFPRLAFDAGLKYAILTMSRYGFFIMGVILALSEIHLDLGRLQWLMAAVGVGLGFGLQEIVSNFVSGIILLVERPVRVGDVVTVGTTSGKVQRINIRATTVVNFDRQEIIVPNRNLITKEVINWTRGDTIIRLVVPIGVAYGSDIDEVTDLLLEIAREQPEINKEPEPQAFFLSHGESSLDFELRVFIPNPAVKMPLLHRLNRTINRRLADRGIEIPFPQRDLHIRSSAVPWPARNTAEAPEDLPVESS